MEKDSWWVRFVTWMAKHIGDYHPKKTDLYHTYPASTYYIDPTPKPALYVD